MDIQLVFDTVWVLAALAQANHIKRSMLWAFTRLPQARIFKSLGYSSGTSLAFHLHTFSMRLSIKDETLYVVNIIDAICEYVNM